MYPPCGAGLLAVAVDRFQGHVMKSCRSKLNDPRGMRAIMIMTMSGI